MDGNCAVDWSLVAPQWDRLRGHVERMKAALTPRLIAGLDLHAGQRVLELGAGTGELAALGVPAVLLFGIPAEKDYRGSGAWDDEAVMKEVRRHVSEELGDEQGVLVIDPSAFVKRGVESCGVKRQWCGRLGGVHMTRTGQAAMAAGTPNMMAVEGSGADPAGTYSPTARIGTLKRSHSTPAAVSMRNGREVCAA